MTSNLQTSVHFRDALEHLHLIDMLVVLPKQLTRCRHTAVIASKHFQTTSSQSVPSCHKSIVSVSLFSRLIITWSVLKPYLSLIVCLVICNYHVPWVGGNTSRSRFAFTKRLCLASSIYLTPFSPIPYNEHTNAQASSKLSSIKKIGIVNEHFPVFLPLPNKGSMVLHPVSAWKPKIMDNTKWNSCSATQWEGTHFITLAVLRASKLINTAGPEVIQSQYKHI